MMTTPEDEALIERLARAEAQAQGLEIEWLEDGSWQPYGIDAETGEKITFHPAQNRLFARTFLAMQREHERARGDIGNPITEQSQREIPEDWRKEVGCHAAKYAIAIGEMTDDAQFVSKDAYDGVIKELFAVADELTTLRAALSTKGDDDGD